MRRPTLFLGIAVVLGLLAKAQAQKGSTGVSPPTCLGQADRFSRDSSLSPRSCRDR